MTQQIPILSVTEFTGLLKSHVEDHFPLVAIRGEVSNVSQSANGHVFLTLKDSKAQLRAVLWRDTARQLKFKLKDGLEVVALGGLDLYPARGTYQLVVQELIPEGIGALELAFRQLREKLAEEGLFAPERKSTTPSFSASNRTRHQSARGGGERHAAGHSAALASCPHCDRPGPGSRGRSRRENRPWDSAAARIRGC